MRKLMLILLALCLAVIPCLAEDYSFTQYDFGDFTLTFPSDMIGEIADEIRPNEVFFTLFHNYNESDIFHMNMNAIWTEDYQDLTQLDPNEIGDLVLAEALSGFQSAGVTVLNPTLEEADIDELNGKPAILLMYSMELNYPNEGYDLQIPVYIIEAIVSDPSFGTYTFSISTSNMDASMPMIECLDNIDWKY